MANLIVQRANEAFKKGDYQNAKKHYEAASNNYGRKLFDANLTICENRIKNKGRTTFTRIGKETQKESETIKKLYKKIEELNYKIIEKDFSINERYKELAILTKMLEEKSKKHPS